MSVEQPMQRSGMKEVFSTSDPKDKFAIFNGSLFVCNPANAVKRIEIDSLLDCTESAQDFLVTDRVKRKWWNPMRYFKGVYYTDRCVGKFVTP